MIYHDKKSLNSYTKMKDIDDITTYQVKDGVNIWTIDTTRSDLIDFEINEELFKAVKNWETHKSFVDKIGLMFNYPEDYISVFILSSLLKQYKVYCHSSEQQTNSSLEKQNIEYRMVSWIYTEEIHHDPDYKCRTVSKEFRNNVFTEYNDKRGFFRVIWDLVTKGSEPKSKMYKLKNGLDVHQAVICGGNSDVFKCNNYFAFKNEEQVNNIVRILSSKKEPNFEDLLQNCEIFIADFKGEDIGYARQMKLFSKIKEQDVVHNLFSNFKYFRRELKAIMLDSKNLEEFHIAVDKLEIKYGS